MWLFNGKEYDGDLHAQKEYEGFVYLIVDKLNNKCYIGRKYLWEIRKVKGKSRRQRKESKWRDYWSSSDVLKERVKEFGEENFERHILCFCKTRGDCNRIEEQLLWSNNVLESDEFYNDTIGNFRTATEHIIEGRLWNDRRICEITKRSD